MLPSIRLCACLLLALVPAVSLATCQVLQGVPAVITQPGSYCLDRSYTVALDTGAAIEIRSSHVTLDLAGHTIENDADPLNRADGVHAGDSVNVTVRGGSLVNFHRGVAMESSTGKCLSDRTGPYRVEDITLFRSRFVGIWLRGCALNVRRNRVFNTGISLEYIAHGLSAHGTSVSVVDNDVQHVLGDRQLSTGMAIYGPRGVVEGNRVQAASGGIVMDSMIVYRDNTLVEFPAAPYRGGVDAGGNY